MEHLNFIMDWDNNILHLNTKINLEYFNGSKWIPLQISTEEYSKVRKNPLYKTTYESYRNFRLDDSTFLNDCIEAINKEQYGTSFEALKKCLIQGNYLYIVTARGHHSDTIKTAISYIINKILTNDERNKMETNLQNYYKICNIKTEDAIKTYIDSCFFIGCCSDEFLNTLPENLKNCEVEVYKKIAIERCIEYAIMQAKKLPDLTTFSVGFSDDDSHNLEAVHELFQDMKNKYPQIKFNLFDTSKNNYTRIKIN